MPQKRRERSVPNRPARGRATGRVSYGCWDRQVNRWLRSRERLQCLLNFSPMRPQPEQLVAPCAEEVLITPSIGLGRYPSGDFLLFHGPEFSATFHATR